MPGSAHRFACGSCARPLRGRCSLAAFHHSMQVCRRILDIVMLVLAGTAFRSQYATTVDILEISIGKLIVSLGIIGLFAINSQIPFAVFGKSVDADVFAFLHGGRLVLAPCISLVEYKSSFVDELFGMLICALVKCHGHECSPFPVVTHPIGSCVPACQDAKGGAR